jgi:predicted dehydrogenase
MGLDVRCLSRRQDIGHYQRLDDAMVHFRPEYIVIASETADHLRVLDDLVRCGFAGKVMCEKPLLAEPAVFPDLDKSKIVIGYPLRFHPAIRKLRDQLGGQGANFADFYVGQYLPTWRANRAYQHGYSAKRSDGGGVLRDLSHELDLALWLFGPVDPYAALGGHFSDLKLDVEDQVSILARGASCKSISIRLDYLNHISERRVLVGANDWTLALDFVSRQVTLARRDGLREDSTLDPIERNALLRDMHQDHLSDGTIGCRFDEAMSVCQFIWDVENLMAKGGVT